MKRVQGSGSRVPGTNPNQNKFLGLQIFFFNLNSSPGTLDKKSHLSCIMHKNSIDERDRREQTECVFRLEILDSLSSTGKEFFFSKNRIGIGETSIIL